MNYLGGQGTHDWSVMYNLHNQNDRNWIDIVVEGLSMNMRLAQIAGTWKPGGSITAKILRDARIMPDDKEHYLHKPSVGRKPFRRAG